MITANPYRIFSALAFCFLLVAAAHPQAYTPPPPVLTTGPCVPTKEFPCDPPPPVKTPDIPATADKFPFPGDNPGTDTANPQSQPAKPVQPPATPAQKFPFPGEDDQKPAAPAPNGQKFPFPAEPDASSSSSSSSSADSTPDSSSSADQSPLKDAGSTGSTRFQRRKLAVPEDLDARELKDLEVSHYYLTTGDFNAAYLRAQDAVKLYPDDENAWFALAVSAEKLKKNDEALAACKKYLTLAPDGEKAKQIKKTLQTIAEK